jgi:hypothetical protein
MTTTELIRRLNESISGGRSFGPAFERDGCLVIPVAYVAGGGGGGSGDLVAPGRTDAEETVAGGGGPPDRPARRPGDGGGFGLVSWPMGAYVVKDGDVTWRPLYSFADLILLILGALWLMGRGRRRRAVGRS